MNDRFYIGSTNNLERRLYEHNSGKSTYTKLTRPFVFIHKESYSSRKEAMQREKFLKLRAGKKWIYDNFR